MNTVEAPHHRVVSHKRTAKPLPISLTRRHQDVLGALGEFPFLTVQQICKLVSGSAKALSYYRSLLRQLYDARLVDRLFLHRFPHGSALVVYTLKRRNSVHRSLLFLEHTLAVTDFILALQSYARLHHLSLVDVVPDWRLRRTPFSFQAAGVRYVLTPDCFVRLRLAYAGRLYELNWAVEVDRGTESIPAFRRKKLPRYLSFVQGPFQQTFGRTSPLTVVVLTTAGPRRVADLTAGVEAELGPTSRVDHADLFRIGRVDFASETPEQLLTQPRFHVPFQREPVALIPRP